jgi:hypothetical protein
MIALTITRKGALSKYIVTFLYCSGVCAGAPIFSAGAPISHGLSHRKLENLKNAGQESMGKCKINNAK